MRQAGLKPKSHKSGVYWTRANANNGKGKDNAASDDANIGLTVVIFFVIGVLLPIYTIYWGVTRGVYYAVRAIYRAFTKS
jgi:hypothetical protein